MKIEVKDIKKQIGAKKRFSEQVRIMLDEIEQNITVAIDVEAHNAGSRIILQGTLATDMEIDCSRCTEPFMEHMKLDLHEEFLPEGSPELAPDRELNLADLSLFVIKEETIDLEEIVRQNILSALPLKPLCRDDCKGLCPKCGENLNRKSCSCHEDPIDIRLAPLKKFIKNG